MRRPLLFSLVVLAGLAGVSGAAIFPWHAGREAWAQDELNNLDDKVIATASLAKLWIMVNRCGLERADASPASRTAVPQPAIYSYEFKGEFPNCLDFLNRLQQNGKPPKIIELHLTSEDSSNARMTMTVRLRPA